jgi:hypothetical protein
VGAVALMPTIPTGRMERELRALYLRWLKGMALDPYLQGDISFKVAQFARWSEELIATEGGRVASLGALGDFPAPKVLELSPTAGTIYQQMQQVAIQASTAAGFNSREVARAVFNAGMDKSYRRLERLARTETTNAYWKNAFDSVADLPNIVMLWGSEDGKRTCQWCRERDGLVMDSPNLRDHPNGRCTPIPTLRSQVEYRGSISPDGRIYNDPAWKREERRSQAPAQPLPDETRAQLDKVVADPRANMDPVFNEFSTGEARSLKAATLGANPGKVANPGSIEYSKNCTRVSAAVEMRARGYNVVAGKVPVSAANAPARNSMWDIDNNWVTAEGRIRESVVLKGQEALKQEMLSQPDGSRFFVTGSWKQGGAHIWNAEVRNGQVHFWEGQTVTSQGKDRFETYMGLLDMDKDMWVKRVDDLVPSPSLKGYQWIVEE